MQTTLFCTDVQYISHKVIVLYAALLLLAMTLHYDDYSPDTTLHGH